MLLLRLRSYQILFHLFMYILQAIDTDHLVKDIDMLLSVIKAKKPNIKNVMSLDNYLVSGVVIYFIRLGSCILRLTISKSVNLTTF